jgi:hypothetical protein
VSAQPWIADGSMVIVEDEDGVLKIGSFGVGADAARAVEAVNAHDALVAQVAALEADNDALRAALRVAVAALAAKPEQGASVDSRLAEADENLLPTENA